MILLIMLVHNSTEKKPLLCIIASQLLSTIVAEDGFVQHAVSILMYGNGTSKQVRRSGKLFLYFGCVYINSDQ